MLPRKTSKLSQAHLLQVIKTVARKLLQGTFTLLFVSLISFAMLSAVGGDALTALSDNPQVSTETVERLRTVYGLDRPVSERYFTWLSAAVRGDLGESFTYRTPVRDLVLSRLSKTLLIALPALILALGFALFGAYLLERTRSGILDRVADLWIALSSSTPRIVAALVALLVIVASANATTRREPGSYLVVVACLIVLALPLQALFLAQARNELGRASGAEFVKFARAKGLSERIVILKHASREALNPLITLSGLSLGSVVSGSIIVETVLGWPGIGALMVTAVRGRDVSLVMGIVIITSLLIWVANSTAELLQMVNDPRLIETEAASNR